MKTSRYGMTYKIFISLSLVLFITIFHFFMNNYVVEATESRGIRVKARTHSGSTKEIQLYSGYHALVIGCGAYTKGWPRLPNPVKDAREVSSMLEKLGWTVDTLENPDGRSLRRELNKLVTGPGKKKDMAILLWFSGHGHTLKEADGLRLGYLVPVDAPDPDMDKLGFMEKAVNMRQIETVVKQIQAKHVLMAFDSCFSGAIFQIARAKPSAYIQEKVAEPVRQFITAGNENEQVPDRSVFKEVFLQGIGKQYADQNNDGYVTGEELGAYLQEKVVNYSRKAQHPQYGKINNPKLDKGDFVFIASGKAVVDKPTYPPGKFKIWLKIKDWHIYSHRILDYKPSWGHLRLLGRYDYLGTLVNKIKSDEFPDYYWLVRIPTEKEGEYEIIAERQREPSFDLKPIEAPKQFSICLQIVNNKVKNHFIQNPHTGWGTFYVDKYRQGILYIRNDFFPGEIWRVKMPKKDGKWTIYAKLSKY